MSIDGITNILGLAEAAQTEVLPCFSRIDRVAYSLTKRILDAFRANRVSEAHFAGTTGYGYDDLGRDTLDKIWAEVFCAQDALVRLQFVSGTHSIACALRAVSPSGGYLSLVGKPYDTLQGIMPYSYVDYTSDGLPDLEAISKALSKGSYPAVLIQRSRGYSSRKALSIKQIEEIIGLVRRYAGGIPVVVDNCYCEFVEETEPCAVGADLIAGSLIKNPGGGLAPTGGYVAGRHELVERAAECLTVPGIGREMGSTYGQNRALYQGLFLAPHTVAQAIKTAVFAAKVLEMLGYSTSPSSSDERFDIIQAINFDDKEKLIRFARGIQSGSPVDSFVTPEPWAMPGYSDEVIMAAGTFIQGASIELSCDGPIRDPYTAYLQGGLTYEAGKLGVISAIESLMGS